MISMNSNQSKSTMPPLSTTAGQTLSRQELDRKLGLIRPDGSSALSNQRPPTLSVRGEAWLLIDVSGSMSGMAIDEAKGGALEFFNEMRSSGTKTGLISFECQARIRVEPGTSDTEARKSVHQLYAGGSTNMTSALRLAFDRLRSQKGSRLVVVVSDGMPDEPDTALATARSMVESGIEIQTIGTRDADRAFLEKLSGKPERVQMTTPQGLRSAIKNQARLANSSHAALPWKGASS